MSEAPVKILKREDGDFCDAALVMRGILIVVIVVGHNRIVMTEWPWLFANIYKWHVQGFFFLGLLSRGLQRKRPRVVDVLTRFYVPFWIFVNAATVLHGVMAGYEPVAHLKALVIGSARFVNAACDMSLFWFLPAFAGFMLLIGAVGVLLGRLGDEAPKYAGSVVPPAIAAASLVLVSAFPAVAMPWVPLGVPIAIYVLPGALAFAAACRALDAAPRKVRAGAMAVGALAFAALCVPLTGVHIDISLFKFGQSVSAGVFLCAFALPIIANVSIYGLSGFLKASRVGVFLAGLGERSMVIFLVHSFIQAPLVMVVSRVVHFDGGVITVAIASGIIAISIAVSWAVAAFLARRTLIREIVLPYGFNTWTRSIAVVLRNPLKLLQAA